MHCFVSRFLTKYTNYQSGQIVPAVGEVQTWKED